MSPMPVITPSAGDGRSSSSSSGKLPSRAARRPNSSKESESKSNLIRARASSFPLAFWRFSRSEPPIASARARRCRRSSTRCFIRIASSAGGNGAAAPERKLRTAAIRLLLQLLVSVRVGWQGLHDFVGRWNLADVHPRHPPGLLDDPGKRAVLPACLSLDLVEHVLRKIEALLSAVRVWHLFLPPVRQDFFARHVVDRREGLDPLACDLPSLLDDPRQ